MSVKCLYGVVKALWILSHVTSTQGSRFLGPRGRLRIASAAVILRVFLSVTKWLPISAYQHEQKEKRRELTLQLSMIWLSMM